MKKTIVMALVLAAAFMLTACGAEETAPPAPTDNVPTPPAPEEPVEDVEEAPEQDMAEPAEGGQVLDKGSDALGGGTKEALGSKIGEVACDFDEQKVTFTFENTGTYTWSLDQEVGFVAQGDVRNVKVFMNHRYEMNRNSPQYHPVTREQMFGPNELFSDNCGGVKELAVGESVTCTLYPVPLNEGSGSVDMRAVNYILIDSPAIDDLIEFQC